MIDEILERYDLKYEDLNKAERDTLMQWMDQLASNKLTLEDVKGYIRKMIFAVQQELTEVGHEEKKDILLKARLKNYMLLEAFLQGPEKAKERLESHLSLVGSKLGTKT